MQYWNEFVAYLQATWPTFVVLGKPLLQAAIIAVLLGLLTSMPSRLIIVPLVAAILYLAADALYPALAEDKEVAMPAFDKSLAYHTAALYVIFIAPILVVFGLKKVVEAVRG